MPEPQAQSVTYWARWVWTEEGWLEGGRVTVAGEYIAAVGGDRQPGEVDLGDQILLPGLVNAHTHLEFSRLAQPLPYDRTFASWIRNVVQWRRGESDADWQKAIQQGLAESTHAGVAAVGEISTRPWNAAVMAGGEERLAAPSEPRSPQLVVFDEVLGLQPDARTSQIADATRHVSHGRELAQSVVNGLPGWLPGLSPHAPYSVSRELFADVVSLARESNCPVAMHLAETREELELLVSGTGPLADLFAEWGLWRAGQRAAFRSPREVLEQLLPLSRVLIIHGNYLSAPELDLLAGRDQFSVVYCPRTHSYFQHDRYPLADLKRRGIRVALGTDSRASNPDLNMLSEVRHVAKLHPEVAPAKLIDMATRNGAEALGLGHRFGTIAPHKRAVFCVLPMSSSGDDPFEVVLDS
ncbi:MAG: amidohydrolase family protein [Planctomycetaceae bacterium]